MAWIPVVEELKGALTRGDWTAAETQVDILATMDHPCDIFQNLTLAGEPVLQHFANIIPRGIDIDRRNKVVKVLTDSGYDINQQADLDAIPIWPSYKLTALLAAVYARNYDLILSLLRHGARTDIRDANGLSPLHWAINVGCRDVFDLLLDFGASVTSSEGERNGEVGMAHPLLHTAVDHGDPGMVSFMLRKEIFDVNEKALYRSDRPWTTDQIFTPLGRAIRWRDHRFTDIIQNLLEQPGIRVEMDDLHYSISKRPPCLARSLIPYFSDRDLSTDKIGGKWALHRLHPNAFRQRLEQTCGLIMDYVGRGWDVNAKSSSSFTAGGLSLGNGYGEEIILTKYNLLHIACIHQGKEVIQLLLKQGADVNVKTEGDVELTPLQILLVLKQWDMASFLIDQGADLNLVGCFRALPFTKVIRRNWTSGKLEMRSPVTALELLLRIGDNGGLPVLDKVLAREGVDWHGADEFHLALEGANPVMITKVLQKCSSTISAEDLNWITVSGEGAVQEKVPSLLWLLHQVNSGSSLRYSTGSTPDFLQALAALLKQFVENGYDLNLTWRSTPETPPVVRESLLHYVLRIDLIGRTNLLLETLLELDNLQGIVPVTSAEGRKYLEYLLLAWNNSCQKSQRSKCWMGWPEGEQPPCCVDAVKLLMRHGLNASQVVIRKEFGYHCDYKSMIQLLYRNGAKIEGDYFSPEIVCIVGSPFSMEMVKEFGELKVWKEKFDQDRPISLQNVCRLRIRKMLMGRGDLKMLEGLPVQLKKFVLSNDFE